jgi:hypothetical protein
MYPSINISAAPFVYGLIAIGLICGAVVSVYIARDARRKRESGRPGRQPAATGAHPNK